MNRKLLAAIAPLLLTLSPLKAFSAPPPLAEVYEQKKVGKIAIIVENLPSSATFNQERTVSRLQTKVGDPFSQFTFDQDLKMLSEEYDRAIPKIETEGGEIYITVKVWQKPVIRSIQWVGNTKIKTSTLQRELGIKAHTIFNRAAFNQPFTKLREYYIKKGYFDSRLDYKLIPYLGTNEISIEITLEEGNSGHIEKIRFDGLDTKEESAILHLMNTKKYNFFTSWLTGTGNYHKEALEHDKLVIVNYLQNEGYADARVNIQVQENEQGRLQIYIQADKGEIYTYGTIDISGNTLLSNEQLEQVITIKKGSRFSPDKLRGSLGNIKDLYGKDGYIETNTTYSLRLSQTHPVYDVSIKVEEGKQFRVGLIKILGNTATNKNVILRESFLVPGEVFDLRKLKRTQMRLEAMGYFKSVNVYPVKTPQDEELGENYRDVIIEVEETVTGNVSLFFGFSSVENVFGGLNIAENNFDHRGLKNFWKGLSNLRGAGEYAHARIQVGRKQQSYTIAWMDPYFRDSLWRFGIDLKYSKMGLQSDDYNVKSFGGSLFGSYPINSYWTYGWKLRLRNSITHIHNTDSNEAQKERHNSGWVTGLSSSIAFDSVDNSFKPHSGFRSVLDLEVAGVRRHDNDNTMFPFLKMSYLNSYYYPVWRKGTLKLRWDFQFAYPLGCGDPTLLPLNERFFLGGETTVRGYRPYILGPHFSSDSGAEKKDPFGGISSTLASIEYSQEIFKMLDIFTFFDGGSISLKEFDIPDFRSSYGIGLRLELANRIPVTFGWGFPINPQKRLKEVRTGADGAVEKIYDKKLDRHIFFFSMGGQF